MFKSISSMLAVLIAFQLTHNVAQAQLQADHIWYASSSNGYWDVASNWYDTSGPPTVPNNNSIVEVFAGTPRIRTSAQAREVWVDSGGELQFNAGGSLTTQKAFIGYGSGSYAAAAVKVQANKDTSWAN